jgi:hypothetical protein
LLLYVLLLAAAWWQSARSGRSPIRMGGLVAIAASAAALYWLYARTSGEVDLASLLQERADFQAGASGGIHLDLIRRGLDVFGSSPWNFLFGIGVGNSPVVLQDFFPGNPYANFHSLYIAVLVEGGALPPPCC